MADRISFSIPIPRAILSLNSYERLNRYLRNNLKNEFKEEIGWIIRSRFSERVPDWGKVSVSFLIKSKRRADMDNRVSVIKFCADSIKESGLVVDDSPSHMKYTFPTWVKKERGEPEVIVEIEKVETASQGSLEETYEK